MPSVNLMGGGGEQSCLDRSIRVWESKHPVLPNYNISWLDNCIIIPFHLDQYNTIQYFHAKLDKMDAIQNVYKSKPLHKEH